ncbi:hypothetical protein J2785_006746 [Burkholderia ambifaria]|nr:hypothetical protein [Burkholderia ambifaria]MDR6503553.1 hypothetical protein [Burkholderia ambifaria]
MQPPIHFAVTNCQDRGVHPETNERYWTADVRAVRPGVLDRTFSDVVFRENSGEMAFALGMEEADGVSANLRSVLQEPQREFVTFVHDQSALDRHPLSPIFSGWEYSAERKMMLAYLSACGLSYAFGFGYFDRSGQYQLLRIEYPEDD